MNNITKGNLVKWVSILFTVLSIIMLFTGWITFSDKDFRKEMKTSAKEAIDAIDELDEEYKNNKEELEAWGITVDLKKVIKPAKKIMGIFKDVKLSPSELAGIAPSISKLSDALSEEDLLSEILGSDFEKVIEALESVKGGMIVIMVLFYITLAVGVLTIILHIADKKWEGILFALLVLAWWIISMAATAFLNTYAENEWNYSEKLVKMTGSPIFAFIFALIAAGLWIYKVKCIKNDAVPTVNLVTANTAQSVVAKRFCPACGNSLKEGAAFCPKCGNKL